MSGKWWGLEKCACSKVHSNAEEFWGTLKSKAKQYMSECWVGSACLLLPAPPSPHSDSKWCFCNIRQCNAPFDEGQALRLASGVWWPGFMTHGSCRPWARHKVFSSALGLTCPCTWLLTHYSPTHPLGLSEPASGFDYWSNAMSK